MAKITLQQAIQYAQAAGFKGQSLITILAIAMAESNLQTDVVNSIGATGILQIYLAVHPDVTPEQAKDPAFSFRYAYKLSGGGKNFCPWQSYDCKVCGNCGTNGWDNRYKQYVPVVTAAVQGDAQNAQGPSATTIALAQAYNAASNTVSTVKNAWSLGSNASVSQALVSFDDAFNISNPFDIDTSGMQDSILGVNVTDPVKWLAQLGTNLIEDLVAIVLRIICIALGSFILYKVVDHFIDFSGMVQTATGAISKIAMAGA